MDKIPISKLDAAKRQLETALKLFFENGDPVSIHTLVSASHELLAVLCRKRGVTPSMLKDQVLKDIRPGKEKYWIKLNNKYANHFKHATKDADATIDFNPEINEILILDACQMYMRIVGSNTFLQRTFCVWVHAKDPNMFIHTLEELDFLEERRHELPINDKPAFLELSKQYWK